MPDKSPRIRPHETQWGTSPGLTMSELRALGERMYHTTERLTPMNPDQQRKIGQMSLTEGTPEETDVTRPSTV